MDWHENVALTPRYHNGYLRPFNPPPTTAELSQLLDLGLPLPEDYLALLHLHDGQDGPGFMRIDSAWEDKALRDEYLDDSYVEVEFDAAGVPGARPMATGTGRTQAVFRAGPREGQGDLTAAAGSPAERSARPVTGRLSRSTVPLVSGRTTRH